MLKIYRVLAFLMFFIVLAVSCDKTPDGEDTEEVSKYTDEEFNTVIYTGLNTDQFSQNSEISEWIELCSQEERDEIGNYALRYTETQGDFVVYKYLIYRTDIEKIADVNVRFTGNNVLQTVVSYTSTEKDSVGYDLVYLQFSVEDSPKVTLDIYSDGDYPGCIITSTEYDIGKTVAQLS